MGTESANETDARVMLSAVLLAKNPFLSDWYREATQRLLDPEDREALREISAETREQEDVLMSLLETWGRRAHPEGAQASEEILRISRIEFLHLLMEAKDVAAQAIEKIAFLAPRSLREDLLDLAAVDFRHATRIRDILSRQIPQSLKDVQGLLDRARSE